MTDPALDAALPRAWQHETLRTLYDDALRRSAGELHRALSVLSTAPELRSNAVARRFHQRLRAVKRELARRRFARALREQSRPPR